MKSIDTHLYDYEENDSLRSSSTYSLSFYFIFFL